MSQLRIRAWDCRNRRMLQSDSGWLSVTYTPGDPTPYILWFDEPTARWETINEFRIMEWTERHGREIFEGDIVLTARGYGEVLWERDHGAHMVRFGTELVFLAAIADEEMELAGNIEEHPELIHRREEGNIT